MQVRALPATWTLRWQGLALAIYVGLNVALIVYFRPFDPVADWRLYPQLVPAFLDGTLYRITDPVPYVWSPLLVPFQAGVGAMGVWPSAILSLAIPLLLRNPVQIIVLYASFMFWPTVFSGSPIFLFTLVAGALAFRGSSRWALVFLALALLTPRPLFVPMVVWLLWKTPGVRWPFVAIAVVQGLAVIATGYSIEWIAGAFRHADIPGWDAGPTAIFGKAWLLVGIPLGAWLTWRNHPGWAGLAVSPYILHGYLLWPIVEIGSARPDFHDGRPRR